MRLRLLHIAVVTTMLLLLCVTAGLPVENSALGEYEVKSAFVYNFTKFVDWPAESFSTPNAPLVVTVLGVAPHIGAFEAIRGKKVRNRRIEVRMAKRLEEVGATHVLFVCASERPHLGRIIEFARNGSILTISDICRFDHAGGVICFTTVDDKVRFHINLAAARKSGLKISSQLIKLARNVIE